MNRNLEKMMDNKWFILEGIIIFPILKNLNNSRKFDDLLDQEKIFKGLETLIKYIDQSLNIG